MRWYVESWSPDYDAPADLPYGTPEDTSRAQVTLDVEQAADQWRPVPAPEPDPAVLPSAVLFVDGVRRLDARVWIDPPPDRTQDDAVPGACASIAAGVVTCTSAGAAVTAVVVQRGLFTTATHAQGVTARHPGGFTASYPARLVAGDPDPERLSLEVQNHLGMIEHLVTAQARDGLPADARDHDLLVLDGPMRGKGSLPRTLGMAKTHRSRYLPDPQHQLVRTLGAGERTPVALVGTTWQRHTWYLRLPTGGVPGPPWGGVVRVECSAELDRAEVLRLADLSQRVLPQHASLPWKDPRAPANLTPIGTLERHLRRQLGDARLLLGALQHAAASGGE